MLEELDLLIRLQQLDDELADIEADRGDLPELLENLRLGIERVRSEICDAENNLARFEIQKKEQEQSIQEAERRLEKSQTVLYSVKTTREYDAVTSEIEQAKHQKVECEHQISLLGVEERKLRITVADLREKLSVLEREYKEKNNDMQERLGRSQDEEIELKHNREQIVKHLKKPVYDHYDRIRAICAGVGVASINENACGYCFSVVPPQRITNVKKMDDLILCEVCGCILVDSPEI